MDTANGNATIQGLTFLVVDDEAPIRRMLRTLIEREGGRVLEAGNGREALGVLEREDRVDAALVDLRMPEMDGLAFMREARVKRPALKAVVVSAYISDGIASEAREIGVRHFVHKPFMPQALLSTLATALQEAEG